MIYALATLEISPFPLFPAPKIGFFSGKNARKLVYRSRSEMITLPSGYIHPDWWPGSVKMLVAEKEWWSCSCQIQGVALYGSFPYLAHECAWFICLNALLQTSKKVWKTNFADPLPNRKPAGCSMEGFQGKPAGNHGLREQFSKGFLSIFPIKPIK